MAIISLLAICMAIALFVWMKKRRTGRIKAQISLDSMRAAFLRVASPHWLRPYLTPMRTLSPSDQKSGPRSESLADFGIDTAFVAPIGFLGPAAVAGRKAEAAIKLREFDKAWGFYEEQKHLYMQHASQSVLTSHQALALDASVSIGMANTLRLEGHHKEALAHALYWAIGTTSLDAESRGQKVRAYFNRCELKRTRLHEVMEYIESSGAPTDLRSVRAKVRGWIERG